MDEDAFAMFTKMKRLDGAQKLALYPKEYLTADIAHPHAQTFDQKYLFFTALVYPFLAFWFFRWFEHTFSISQENRFTEN